jgi:hypothetical protein
MSSENASPSDALGSFEYELTDDLATAAGIALYEHKTGQVKAQIVRNGAPHPALPLVGALTMVVVALVAAAIFAWESVVTRVLIGAGFLVLLVLLFKTALYFCPPFARWHVRRQALRMTRKLKPRTIRWTLFADRLETKSAVLSSIRPWKDLLAMQRLEDFWLLRWRGGLEFFVPRALMPAEVEAILLRKAVEAEATIEGGRRGPGAPLKP